MSSATPRYRFGPRSTRGLIAGWSGGQVVSLAVGALLALVVLRSVGGGTGVVLALVALGGGLAVARLPVAGRPLEAWAPTLARFTALGLSEGRLPWQVGRRAPRRGPLARLELRSLGRLAVVVDREAGTWSTVLTAGGDGFALRDEEGQAASVSSWAEVLSALGVESDGLHRLQCIVRNRPGRTEWLGMPKLSGSLALAYEELVAARGPELQEREVLLVLTTPAPGGLGGQQSRRRGEEAAAERLWSAAFSLAERLRVTGLEVAGPLCLEELSLAIRRAYEEPDPSSPGAWPFPLGLEASWSRLRTDASWQAVYWVSEWPRSEVGPAVLLPLLLGDAARQSVSLVLAPVGPMAAVRRAERERTSGEADRDLKRRHGFSLTARSRAEQELAESREEELAAGHGAFFFSGYVAVSASDEKELESACAAAERAALLSHLELRRLYGAQEEGFACTLPTGRGCR